MEPIQTQVLHAAQSLCRERGGWTFEVGEVVAALPGLNPQSVRTHVTSRCCVNAPPNHPHRWPYFRRIGRGKYEITPAFRRIDMERPVQVREAQPSYVAVRDVVHAVITRSERFFVGEVFELPVVTQGRSLDETVANLREAVALHLSGETGREMGVSEDPRIAISYETRIGV